MPGRDITRLRNKAARVLLLFAFLIGAAMLLLARSQAASPQDAAKPAPASTTPASTTPAQNAPAQNKEPQENKDKLNDQGVFVFKKDVDEVLLHASVTDDRQHIVTNLDRTDFTVFEDGKQQNIISFRH